MLLYLMFNPNGIKLIHTLLLDSPSYTFPFTHQQTLIALLHDSVIFWTYQTCFIIYSYILGYLAGTLFSICGGTKN